MSWNLKYQIQINVNVKICRNPTLKCVQLENIFIEQFPYPYISNSPDYFILGNMSSLNFYGTSCIRHPRVNRFMTFKMYTFLYSKQLSMFVKRFRMWMISWKKFELIIRIFHPVITLTVLASPIFSCAVCYSFLFKPNLIGIMIDNLFCEFMPSTSFMWLTKLNMLFLV